MKTINIFNKDKVCVVDDTDYEVLKNFDWTMDKKGYVTRKERIGGRSGPVIRFYIHRVVMGIHQGERVQIDHINGNKLDNRKCNLRICTNSQNQMNRGKTIYNTSGYKGVTFNKSSKKWQSQIIKDGKMYYLGVFENPIDAAKAYNTKAIELHGDYARINDII